MGIIRSLNQEGDQGMFFTDGKDTLGSNWQSAFVLAPWAPRGDSTIGGMRMDRNGNIEGLRPEDYLLAIKYRS